MASSMDETTESADAAPDDRAQAAGVSLPRQSIGSVKNSVKMWMSVRQPGELVALTETILQVATEQQPSVQITEVAGELPEIDKRENQ